MCEQYCRKRRGAALLSALVVTFVAVAAVTMLAAAQALGLRRTANLIDTDVAWAQIRWLEWEAIAAIHLARQGERTPLVRWPLVPRPLGAEGNPVIAELLDLNARFNLNNLVAGERSNRTEVQRFERLLSTLGISGEIVEPILDWLDPDSNTRPGGAEDDYYIRLPTPYRVANGSFARTAELLLVRGMTPDIYARLEPFVTALPGRQQINLNTAPPQLLQALDADVTSLDADAVVVARAQKPFDTVAAAMSTGSIARLGVATDGLATRSRFFLLSSTLRAGGLGLHIQSVLDVPEDGTARVLFRTAGGE